MKPSTLPKVTVGNTGCRPEALAVFNYEPEARSWMAVCKDELFSCSDAGHRTGRCHPLREGARVPGMAWRARLLLELPPDRRDVFITEDIMYGSDEAYVKRLAFLAAAPESLDVDDVWRLFPLEAEPRRAVARCGGAGTFYMDVESGKIAVPRYKTWQCLFDALNGIPVPDEYLHGSDGVRVYTGQVDGEKLASFEAEAEALKEQMESATASEGTEASTPPDAGGASAAPEPAAPAESVPGSASEQEPESAPPSVASLPPDQAIRAQLDEHREDILACLDAERVVVRVEYTTEGEGTLSLRGDAKGTPLEECVRATVGPIHVEGVDEAGVVVHVVH